VKNLARRKPNPADSLARFMYGIFDYYHDRGMPKKTAKVRMIDNTLEECVKIMKNEEEVPDHMLVVMAQWMSRALNHRGAQMTKKIKEMQNKANATQQSVDIDDELLQPLRDIKAAKDAVDRFIETYKGWSDTNG
jgi:hypothetical protein